MNLPENPASTEQALRQQNERLRLLSEAMAERLSETKAELEDFSYSITHDMRAPLRAMQSFAMILDEEAADRLNEQERDHLRRIIVSANRMDKLICDVLAYSKVLRAELKLESVDIRSLIQGILDSYPAFRAGDATIAMEGDFPRVLGNEAALTQCTSNLLHNAVTFVSPGEQASVRIWAEGRAGRVRIWFEDNGIGIDPAYGQQIFKLFHRLHSRYEGTGAGLAIARKAAERMGGSMGFEPAPSCGSRFWIELKAAEPECEA